MTVEALQPDAKTTEDSSNSDPDDANNESVSSTDQSEDIESTLDAVTGILDDVTEDGGEDSPDPDQTDAPEEDPKTDDDADKADDAEEDTPEATVNKDDAEVKNIEDELPKEFHEHPRFKELVEQKNQSRDEADALKTQVTELERKAEYFDALGQDNLDGYVEFMRKSVDDPMEAIKQIQPMLNDLAERAGLRLSPSLNEKVEEGELTREEAMERQKLEAENKNLKQKDQHKSQVQQQAAEEAHKASLVNVAVKWEAKKQSSDPDYTQIQKIFSDVVLADFTKNGWPTKEAIPKRLEEIYSNVKTQIGSRKPEEKTIVKGSPTPKGKEKKVFKNQRDIIDSFID
jgi:hypothetical protein